MNLRCFNPQFFIASKVGDEALEHDEERRARKLDHDLRILIDALRVLSAAIPADHVLHDDRLALDRLEELGREVDLARAHENGHTGLSTADVDDFIRKLRQLRRDDPPSADDILRRLVGEAGPTAAQTVTA